MMAYRMRHREEFSGAYLFCDRDIGGNDQVYPIGLLVVFCDYAVLRIPSRVAEIRDCGVAEIEPEGVIGKIPSAEIAVW